MTTKETALLQDLQQLIEEVAEGPVQSLADPEGFIAYYYQQEEALQTIKEKLFNYYPKETTKAGSLIQGLQYFMREREQALLAFYDWGNPVALVIEKDTTLATLSAKLARDAPSVKG